MSGIAAGPGGPVFIQETATRQGILANGLFIDETVAAASPSFDPNGVQGSGGGPPKKRRPTLHLDERYRPQIVDPREFRARKPVEPDVADDAPIPGERPLPPEKLPEVRSYGPLPPDGLPERLEASIAAIERKRALAAIAADDEAALMAIIRAIAQETGHG